MNNNWIGVMYVVINLSESQAGEDEDVSTCIYYESYE